MLKHQSAFLAAWLRAISEAAGKVVPSPPITGIAFRCRRASEATAGLMPEPAFPSARGERVSPTHLGHSALQLGSFLAVNRVFEEHLRLRDTSDEPALDCARSASG
jgi:hypothetical protein